MKFESSCNIPEHTHVLEYQGRGQGTQLGWESLSTIYQVGFDLQHHKHRM